MDRATELTDAFVEVKFAHYEEFRTQICRRTLNPVWNEDFRFEVSDDADLQNEPLELKVMDYDQITYNDSIGTVFIDLNPLLTWDSTSQISGWIPIFDTLRGVRGELNVQVRLQFFGDVNPFKDSSAGVRFYTMSSLPASLNVAAVLGFVSALDNEDDPEYHWSDNFRTPRTSNESRTRVMYRLSGQLRRQMGKKVLEMNGNAVVGFKQYFDIESEERIITARAIGTAVRLLLPEQISLDRGQSWSSIVQSPASSPLNTPFTEHPPVISPLAAAPTVLKTTASSAEHLSEESRSLSLHEESSAPNLLIPTAATGYKSVEHVTFTLHSLPVGSIFGIGGLVSATSVKVIDDDKTETREAWWAELREEIKSHARALGCPYVAGYTEDSCVNGDVMVLHCSGTAVIMDVAGMAGGGGSTSGGAISTTGANVGMSQGRMNSVSTWDGRDGDAIGPGLLTRRGSVCGSEVRESFLEAFINRKKRARRAKGCQACHIAYRRDESPFPMSYAKCGVCKKKYVPEVLLTTIDPPPELETVGNGILLEAHVCRYRKTHDSSRPSIISESIPFAQYDIHRQLIFKLRIYGLNAVFGLKIQFSIGEDLMTAVATGTAVYVRALPPPLPMKVFRNLEIKDEEDKKLMEVQRAIMARSENNRKVVEMALAEREGGERNDDDAESDSGSDSDSDSDDEQEFTRRHRSVVVQIDDESDEDLVLLQDPAFPPSFQICNTSVPPSSDTLFTPSQCTSVQNITLIKHATINAMSHHPNRQLAAVFREMYEQVVMQLGSYFNGCTVAALNYTVEVVKENEVQVVVNGVALGKCVGSLDEIAGEIGGSTESFALGDTLKKVPTRIGEIVARQSTRESLLRGDSIGSLELDEEMLFPLDDDSPDVGDTAMIGTSEATQVPLPRSLPQKAVVDITPLWYIPNTVTTQHLGRISLHFVKEAAVVFEVGAGNTGMGGFTHAFLMELYAVVRAHAAALGGNALVAFVIDHIIVEESLRNQAYALISVGGDVVTVEDVEAARIDCASVFADVGGVL